MSIREIIFIVIAGVVLLGAWLVLMPQSIGIPLGEPAVVQETTEETAALDPAAILESQEETYLDFVKLDPETYSSLRLFGDAADPVGDQLTDVSNAAQQAVIDFAEEALAENRSFAWDNLPFQSRVSTEIFDWFFDMIVRGEEFQFHNYPVNQTFGIQNTMIAFMTDIHEIHSRLDAENYITRLSKFDTKFDQVLEGLRTREERGIILPQTLGQKVLAGINGFISTPADENPLYTTFAEKIAAVSELSDSDRASLSDAVINEISNTVYPAYQRLAAYFEEVMPKAPGDDQVGVWHLPNGDAYYQYLVRFHTTTELTPEEVHQIGLAEVARIQAEVTEMMTALGCQGANFGELRRTCQAMVQADPAMTFGPDEAGRTAALAAYQSYVSDLMAKLGEVFDILPKAPVEVRAVPQYAAATSPGAYYNQPSLDGSRPGVFYANIWNGVFKPGTQTLTCHEAVPGHHFQLAVQQEAENLPTFQKLMIYTAHVEGWALYAEKLCRERGYYTDIYSEISNRLSELFRAARLVVDTGLHYKRWTRQQTIDYMTLNLGFPAVGEIDRYIAMPGQALGYKIGELKILEMRQHMMDALGDDFNIKEFHNLILLQGGMPLAVLEAVVNQYIEEKLSSN